MSETDLQNQIRIALSKLGARIFRNQVGFYRLQDGRALRSGLCPGSSDLIGWRSIRVTPQMVGHHIAVFVAVEVKLPGQRPTPEQQQFLHAVERAGGIAVVATSTDEAIEKVM